MNVLQWPVNHFLNVRFAPVGEIVKLVILHYLMYGISLKNDTVEEVSLFQCN